MNQLCLKIKSDPVTDCAPVDEVKVCQTTVVTKTYCVPLIQFDYFEALDRLTQVLKGLNAKAHIK